MALDRRGLSGRRVVVTAGGTREPIDPVRFLGNRSSGKMGNAIAIAARDAGATVFLVTAAAPPPVIQDVTILPVETAAEMHVMVSDCVAPGSILIMAAAVADYRPAHYSGSKLKKLASGLSLELVPTVDILKSLADSPIRDQLFVVGFAAETDHPVDNGRAKLIAKRLDLCVINDVAQPGIGMGSDDNAVTIIDANGVVEEVSKAPKRKVAEQLLAVVAARLAT